MDSIHKANAPKQIQSILDIESGHIVPQEFVRLESYDYITLMVFVLIGAAAIIWHFMPDRFRVLFSIKTEKSNIRTGEINPVVPGSLITGFMGFNFLVTSGIFVFFVLKYYFPDLVTGMSLINVLGYDYLVLIAILLYRIILTYGISYLFDTRIMRRQQNTVGRNILFMTGIFLLFVIPLLIYSNVDLILIFSLGVISILQIIRVIRTIVIGKSSRMFSTLHIILYLCALEIVPILVLIRMIGNSSGVY